MTGTQPIPSPLRPWSELEVLSDVEIRWDEPLARHTTFRVGGSVRCLVRPSTYLALRELAGELERQRLPRFILGGGSNLLASDEPRDVAAVQLTRCCAEVFERGHRDGKEQVYVGAGMRLSRLLSFCLDKELGGIEHLVGIPGTVGGALIMNAGTQEGCIGDVLLWVDLLEPDGRTLRLNRSELPVAYRSMGLPDTCLVIGACLGLSSSSRERMTAAMRTKMMNRRRTQPLGFPSAGCIFKNPPGHAAGALIDRAGLKGFVIGGAQVSEKHGNWIINRGDATAGQILDLVKHVEHEVFRRFGIRLEREIRLVEEISSRN